MPPAVGAALTRFAEEAEREAPDLARLTFVCDQVCTIRETLGNPRLRSALRRTQSGAVGYAGLRLNGPPRRPQLLRVTA
jgi:hypothetical protein